ncbi:MAG: Cell envelope-related function transcriptional attenuator common-like protein [Chloroflexi bacterium]|nr:Cell envelope-related function transcriptional attenuator common-like protein [Chloroflexota bacterium]
MTTTDPVDDQAPDPSADAAPSSAAVPEERQPGSRYVPAVLSAVLPGLGQLRLGQRRLALAFGLPIVLLIAGGVAAVIVQGPARAATTVLAEQALWGLLGLQFLLLGSRLAASGAALFDRRFGPLRWRDAVLVSVLAIAIVAPQAWALAATNALRLAAAEIFVNEDSNGGAWSPAPPTPGPSSAAATAGPSAAPSATPADARVNVLIIGVDAGVGRRTFLTDTMIVVSLDPVAGTVSMLSVPRDMVDVPLPDGTVFPAKINSLVSWARHNPSEFPGSDGEGYDVLMGAIGTLLELRIDLYAQVSLGGFVSVIDRLDGVDVNVRRAFCDPGYREYGYPNGFSITAGLHRLDGQAALAYARVRKASGESDFTRAARQQEVLSGIRDAIVRGRFLQDPVGLLDAIGRTISTNVPRSMLPDLAAWAAEVDRADTYRAVIAHPLVKSGFDERGSIQVPDVPAIRALAETLVPPAGELPDHPSPSPTPTALPSDSAEPSTGPSPEPSNSTLPSADPGPTASLEPSPSPSAAP